MNSNIETIASIYDSNERYLLEEDFYSKNEHAYLKNNYEEIKRRVLNSDTEIKDKFCDQLIGLMETVPNDENYNANLAESILLYSNFYKTYGSDLFSVRTQDLHLAISVFENFISGGEKEIGDMMHVIDPIVYHPDLIDELRNVEKGNEAMVAHHIESVTEGYKRKISNQTIESMIREIVESKNIQNK